MTENRTDLKWWHLVVAFLATALTVVGVVMIFRMGLPRLWAARWASACFLAIGAFLIYFLWPQKRNFWTITWFAAWIHFGFFSLPMGGYRWFTEASFDQLRWFGITGPQLHTWSTNFYYFLLAAPFGDGIRLFLKNRTKN